MKKILTSFLLIFVFCIWAWSSLAGPDDCTIDPTSADIKSVLESCQSDGSVDIDTGGNDITSIKEYVTSIAETVIAYGALFAVGALVASGVMYTVAYGNESRVTTAKNIALYALIGLVLLVAAFPLVSIIVDFIYWLW